MNAPPAPMHRPREGPRQGPAGQGPGMSITAGLFACYGGCMRLSEIDLNLLVVFEAIYREGNLTRASKKLHLTQPALSHALSRLREMFGDPLFARSGRTMAPTPFARNVIGPVREAL